MWFDRENKHTLFADNRYEKSILCDGRVLEIKPDLKFDFTNMPFNNNVFYLVVFDPPHLINLGKKSWMAKKYGYLFPTWESDIKAGFDECMRVLKLNGTLIFKWNENQISINKIIKIINKEWRFIVADKLVITGSDYMADGRKGLDSNTFTKPREFAQEIASSISDIEIIYVLDICEVNNRFYLLEFNPDRKSVV